MSVMPKSTLSDRLFEVTCQVFSIARIAIVMMRTVIARWLIAVPVVYVAFAIATICEGAFVRAPFMARTLSSVTFEDVAFGLTALWQIAAKLAVALALISLALYPAPLTRRLSD